MKRLLLVLLLALALGMAGCSSGESPVEEETTQTVTQTTETAPAAKPDREDQLRTLAACRGLWIRSDPQYYYNYAVTDLDQNGRLELVVTVSRDGDQGSVTEVWEVNEAGDGVDPCTETLSSTAALAVETAEAFFDAPSDTYTYLFPDAGGGEKRGFTLKNGVFEAKDELPAGQQTLTAAFLWQAPFHDEIDVLTQEDWYRLLADSWQAFQLN